MRVAKQRRRESPDTDGYKDDVIVSYIHHKLIDLGYSTSKNELKRKHFGRTSIEAVKDIQSKNQLNVTGTADDDTIDLIKRLTADIINNSSGSNEQKSSHVYNVTGTVRSVPHEFGGEKANHVKK